MKFRELLRIICMISTFSQDQIAALEREAIALEIAQARERMAWFAKFVVPNYILDPYHILLCDTLDRVISGNLKRLIVVAPPQGGKSLTISNIFAARWMGVHPDMPGILLSYGDEHADTKARRTRDILLSRAYSAVYPHIKIRSDSRAVERFQIEGYEGGLISAGMMGSVTGFSGGAVIIDDPHRNIKDVQSKTMRETVFEWWRSVLIPRVWENAPIVIIATRWSTDDLIGRILRYTQDDYTILRIPALSETQEERDDANRLYGLPGGLPDPLGRHADGLSYFPDRFSSGYLYQVKHEVGSMAWSAEYQGAPRLAEGNMIKRTWLSRIVPSAPLNARRIRYWDKAGTADGGARTAGVLIAKADDKYYIEDVVFGQWSAYERNEIIKATAEADALRAVIPDPEHPDIPPENLPGYGSVETWIEQEPGSGGKESAQITVRDLSRWSVRSDVVSGAGDKDIRLRPFAAQAEAGNIYIVRGPWNDDYIDEMISIPNGVYRDMGDATAGAYNKLHSGGIVFGTLDIRQDATAEFLYGE